MLRIVLFIVTNILVIATVSIITSVLGLESYMTANGINYSSLMIFCLLWGMVGSFISLAISRWIAKKMMGVKLVKSDQPGEYQWIAQMTEELAKSAGLPGVPEVGVYQSDEVNAFATGPSKKRSLVAYSTGILREMDQESIRGVAAHEIAHIKNGDMVTMTLIQGIINAFVMFFARIVAYAISQSVREELATIAWYVTVILCQILFGILGSTVTAWFSRKREFKADAGSAEIAGVGNMVKALEFLKAKQSRDELAALPSGMAAFGIAGGKAGWKALFSTHPPLEQRIEALQQRSFGN